MRWDNAFLSTFAPAAHAAQQDFYNQRDLERRLTADADARAQLEARFDRELAQRERHAQATFNEQIRANKANDERLAEDARRRSRERMDAMIRADDAVKAKSALDSMRLKLESDKLDADLFSKKVASYAANLDGLDEITLSAVSAPILKKQAAGLPLSHDERAALAAGEQVLAARRRPQLEKVYENLYQTGPDGKPLADETGRPIIMGRREFVRPLPKATPPEVKPPVTPAAPSSPVESGALGATLGGFETFDAGRRAEEKRKAAETSARADARARQQADYATKYGWLGIGLK